MINALFKEKVASSIADLITEVVLNDNLSITNFKIKKGVENVAFVEFEIPENSGVISEIQIKSGTDVISESSIYMEVKTEAQFSYRVEVEAKHG